jgi:hypothetical protein
MFLQQDFVLIVIMEYDWFVVFVMTRISFMLFQEARVCEFLLERVFNCVLEILKSIYRLKYDRTNLFFYINRLNITHNIKVISYAFISSVSNFSCTLCNC